MSGFEIFIKALKLLNYISPEGDYDSSLTLRALPIINAVYADIYYFFNSENFKPLTDLNETVNLSEKILNDVFPYGVAMHIAIGEADALNQQIFGNIYNSKKVRLSFSDSRIDVLP